jgi:hypothetical protein
MKYCVTFSLLLLSVLCAEAPAAGPPPFSDDFEAYFDQAAFAAAWSPTGAPPHVLDTAFGRNSTRSLKLVPQTTGSGTSNRWYRNLSTTLLPTDAAPVLFSFDFYLEAAGASSTWAQDWQLIDIRAFSGGSFGSGTLTGLVGMGVKSGTTLNADTYSSTYFQGRIINPTRSGNTYNTLDQLPTAVPRSTGWHTLAARIGATQTQFFVDGLPAETVTAGIATPLTSVILGSDIPSPHAFWVDNIQLEVVPEPSSASLLLVFCLAASIRRRPLHTA